MATDGPLRPLTRQTEEREEMQKQKGFSLIELLIVVAIILIIAAIAIPNLLRARIAANESSAVSAIRTINTAEVTYQSAFPTVGYSATLDQLGRARGATCPRLDRLRQRLPDRQRVVERHPAGTARAATTSGETRRSRHRRYPVLTYGWVRRRLRSTRPACATSARPKMA